MSENIKFNEWEKIDLKVGKIIGVENIEGADKLYKLTIDLGIEKRTLVAGLKEFYSKEELQNKNCIVFVNLEPKKLRGIESQGMILAAISCNNEENGKKVSLLQPDKDIEPGSKIS